MRRLTTLSAAALAFGIAAAPCLAGGSKLARKDIPAPVLQAFEKAYPGMQIKSQRMMMEESVMLYKLEYVDKKVKHDVIITAQGAITGTDQNIAVAGLPPAVVTGCKAEFPTATIKEAETMIRDNVVTYGLDLKIGKDRVDAIFAADGKLIKKEEKAEKESEKDEGDKNEIEKDDDK